MSWSNPAGDVGEIEPNLDAAEMRTFRADGSGNTGAEMAGRADVFGELRMDFAELGDFVERCLIDLLLGVEAGAHGPFVEKMEQRARFDQANRFGVGQEIEGDFRRDAPVEKLIFCGPGIVHGAEVNLFCTGVGIEEHGSDEIRVARIRESEQWARSGYHAMTLVLAIGGMRDFFCESVTGVLERAHDRCMDAYVEGFEAI